VTRKIEQNHPFLVPGFGFQGFVDGGKITYYGRTPSGICPVPVIGSSTIVVYMTFPANRVIWNILTTHQNIVYITKNIDK
jgi:hypothetical protein